MNFDQEHPLRALIVSARFPPMDSTGTIRVDALRRHLPAAGVDATYVTIPPRWMGQQDGTFDSGSFERSDDAVYPETTIDSVSLWASGVPLIRRVQRWLSVPDVLITWAKHASASVINDLGGIDIVYATGPPFSALELGRRLAVQLGVPFVSEFRDPPLLDRRAARSGPMFLRRLGGFQRRILGASSRVVVVTPGVKKHFLSDTPSLVDRITVIPNGVWQATPETIVRERSTVLYAGSLRSSGDVEILDRVATAVRSIDSRGVVLLLGRFSTLVQDRLAHRLSNGSIEFGGRVTRHRSLGEMAAAEVSLVLVGRDEWWWIGRKVIESIQYSRRILAFAPDGNVKTLLSRSSKSAVLSREAGVREVEQTLRSLLGRNVERPGVEPDVPSDLEVALAVAGTMRAAVDGSPAPLDWHWSRDGGAADDAWGPSDLAEKPLPTKTPDRTTDQDRRF